MAFVTGDNNFGTAKWIVDPTAGQGTHTTIASAIASASSGQTIFIRPGTYTENLTLKAGVNLVCYDADTDTPNVVIIGKLTFTTAGIVSLSALNLQTNGDFFLAVTGSAASQINLFACELNCVNNTGISYTSSNSSSAIFIYNSNYSLGTSSTALFASTSPGSINFFYTNSLGTTSSAANTASAGTVNANYSVFTNPMSITSTGNISMGFSGISVAGVNTTALTMNGAASEVTQCYFLSGSASAISIGGGSTLTLDGNLPVNSSNTNAITGTGTIKYGAIDFTGSSSVINTTTVQNSSVSIPRISSSDGTSAIILGTGGTVAIASSLSSAPAASQTSSLSLGSAYQNPFGYDVILTVYINITVNTTGTITCGVGPTNTPTAQTLLSGLTTLGFFPITVYLPKSYYVLITTTNVTSTISGQQALPV